MTLMTICPPLYAESTEYVSAYVRGRVDLGTQDVSMAFLADSDARPGVLDWVPAEWTDSNRQVRVLVGPEGGEIELAPGHYFVWLKIDDDPEVVILLAGTLDVD